MTVVLTASLVVAIVQVIAACIGVLVPAVLVVIAWRDLQEQRQKTAQMLAVRKWA